MPRQQVATTAASSLHSWTDADTAMQIVGTSLGLFGTGRLDPGPVLSKETPLRNALFDVLLSLVEGGAVELRPTEDAGYAFRWRSDYAVAGVSPSTTGTIDLAVPTPYLAELTRAQRERDEALGRAEFAEALAAERERLLRLADAPARPSKRPTLRPARRREPQPAVDIDLTAPAALEIVPSPPAPAEEARPAEPAAPEPEIAAAPAAEPRPAPAEIGETITAASEPIEAIEPVEVVEVVEADEPVEAEVPVEILEPVAAVIEPEPAMTAPKKATPKKAVRKKSPRKKSAPRPAAAVAAEAEPEPEVDEAPEPEASDVIYLTQPAPEAHDAPQPKWSGYTIDKPRSHLSSVDRLADQI